MKKDVKKWAVNIIANERIIKSVMFGSTVALIGLTLENFAITVNFVLSTLASITIPPQVIKIIGMAATFVTAEWAYRHTDEWKDMIEEKTGEEVEEQEGEENG